MPRRAQNGLNKGEARHALKNALRIGRQGEIRDRTSGGRHYRMAGLNLLAAIAIFCNTKYLENAVAKRRREGLDCLPNLLAHISPLGWAHIIGFGDEPPRYPLGKTFVPHAGHLDDVVAVACCQHLFKRRNEPP